MSTLILATQNEQATAENARQFCTEFCSPNQRGKYIFGRNVYAESVMKSVEITGFIDDFTNATSFLGRPVLKTENVEKDSLVLIASGGRPLSAKRRLDAFRLQSLDYFSFYKFAGLPLTPVIFNEGFAEDFQANEAEYEWIYGLLEDEISRLTFKKLVSFRLRYELSLLNGFTSREDEQYFEDFLQLQSQGETFVDVGGYNGFNSLEFIKQCPEYEAVHIFEPEPDNYQSCRSRLKPYPRIYPHELGLSDRKQILKIDPQGSGSKISDRGSTVIAVDRLDDILLEQYRPTFIKMDIEGTEIPAIEGASHTIKKYHPRLALCVYHKAGDFWRIPKKVLALRDDYNIFLRHYTESIYETVMFFVPN